MTSSATADTPRVPHKAAGHPRKSVYMVLGCTVFAAVAQVLLKFGSLHPMPQLVPGNTATWMPFVIGLLSNGPLVFGYTLHAANAMLLILALREGQLSVLYPIYALSYVWVNLLSMYFFAERLNIWKSLGIALVIAGVAYLGRASGSE